MAQVGIDVGGAFAEIPGVYASVDTTAMVPVLTTRGGIPLAIVSADSGDPTKVYSFRSFQEAKAVLKGGRCLSYLARIFNPSPNQPGAPLVKVIRANTATQSGITLVGTGSSPQPETTFTSLEYGAWTNQIRVGVTRAATGDAGLPLDNNEPAALYRLWTINIDHLPSGQSYSYVVRSGLLISDGSFLDVNHSAETVTYTTYDSIDHVAQFSDVPTLRDVANWINFITGSTSASVVGPSNYPVSVLNDEQVALADGYPIFCPAEAGALAYLLNTRLKLVSVVIPDYLSFVNLFQATTASAYMTSGSGSGIDVLDSTDVEDALALAEATDAHLLFVQTSTAALQALALAHCQAMSTDIVRKFRILVTGINFTTTSNIDGADGTSTTTEDAAREAATRSQALEGPSVLCWNGTVAANPVTGINEQLGGLGLAAQIIGMRAGMVTAEPLTNKAVRSNGLEFPYITESVKIILIEGGVLATFYKEDALQTRILQALTTYQTTDPSYRLLHGLWIQHTIKRMWLMVLANYVGAPLDLEVGLRIKADGAKALDRSIKSGANPNGVLTEGRDSDGTRVPAWDSMSVVGDSTVGAWAISVNAHPVGETDFVVVTTKLTPAPLFL